MNKREEEEKDAFAFMGLGCLITTIQAITIGLVLLLTDFDWITKWLFVFPVFCYLITFVTFVIKMIQIEMRY